MIQTSTLFTNNVHNHNQFVASNNRGQAILHLKKGVAASTIMHKSTRIERTWKGYVKYPTLVAFRKSLDLTC